MGVKALGYRVGRGTGPDRSVLELLQDCNESAEIWWDSSPLDFPGWRRNLLAQAPDRVTARRWSAQLDRFLVIGSATGGAGGAIAVDGTMLVRGVTTNPSLIARSVLAGADQWRRDVRDQIRRQQAPSVEGTYWLVYQEAVRRAASAMLPMWRASNGRYGWVSGQLDPRWLFDRDRMLEQALQLARLSPNLMIKVPGTEQGYEVVRQLAAQGIATNGTFSYTMAQFISYIEAIETGRAEAQAAGVDLSRTRAVITHMIGRLGGNGDMREEAAARGLALTQTELRWAELAVLKRLYALIRSNDHQVKVLLSSLETDDPAQGATTLSMHLQHSAGADIAYTCKPQFITDIMRREHELHRFDPEAIDAGVPEAVLDKLMRLPSFRRAIEAGGLAPTDYPYYGPFVVNHAEVLRNLRQLIDFVDQQFTEVRAPHRTIRVPEPRVLAESVNH